MNVNFINPPAHAGEREIWELWGNGPSSYNQVTGDILQGPGVGEFFGAPMGGFLTLSQTYELKPFPSTVNSLRATWAWRWFYSGAAQVGEVVTGVSFTAGSGQTNGTYVINGSGGGGSGAQVQIVIAGGAITSATVISPGKGYTGTPTFTVAAGGTPGTLTPTVANPAGTEVATGVNLSGEQVQFMAIGGEL